MPNLSFCSVQLTSASHLLKNPQISLRKIELFAFYRLARKDRLLRRSLLRALIKLSHFFYHTSLHNFPRLRTIQLPGISELEFRTTYWYPVEEVTFAYCLDSSAAVNVQLTGDDGFPLFPSGDMRRLTPSILSYHERYCPFVQ